MQMTREQVNDREAAAAVGCKCGWSVGGDRVTNPHVSPLRDACPYHNWCIAGNEMVAVRHLC